MSVNPPPPPGSFPGPPPGYNPPPPPPPQYQQQSYPPPAYGQAPMAPPPAKKNWIPWIIGGCGCLVVAAAIAAFVIFAAVKAGTAGAEEVIQGFLESAGEGRYQEAYGHFSAPLKATQSYDDFEASASANSHLFRVKDTTFNQRSVDTTSANLSGSVTLESGTEVPAKFDLVQENGAWKILNYSIGTND